MGRFTEWSAREAEEAGRKSPIGDFSVAGAVSEPPLFAAQPHPGRKVPHVLGPRVGAAR